MTDHDNDGIAATSGWCAPADQVYPWLPEVTVKRGGIGFTTGPEAPPAPPTREDIRAAIDAIVFQPVRNAMGLSAYEIAPSQLESLRKILILADIYTKDDGALSTWSQVRSKTYEASAERGRALQPRIEKLSWKNTKLRRKVRRLRSRLSIAQETNRIHVDARRTLEREKATAYKAIDQLRVGHSVPPQKSDSGHLAARGEYPGVWVDGPPEPHPRGPQYYGSWIDEHYLAHPEPEAWTGVQVNGHRGSVPASMVVDLDTLNGLVTPGFSSDLPPVYFTTPDGEG